MEDEMTFFDAKTKREILDYIFDVSSYLANPFREISNEKV